MYANPGYGIATLIYNFLGLLRIIFRLCVVPHYKYCYISYNRTITSILFSAIIAFLVVMLLHITVSRKYRNNLESAAKN